ncbi:type 2 periplasmic-binding domain-containing protein [Alcanivorax sediminis]
MKKGLLARFLLVAGMLVSITAMADPVVVVGAESSISSLSQNQVRQIFNGQLRRVSGVSVKPLDLPGSNGTRELFYQQAMGKSAEQMKSYWARMIFTGRGMPPREVSSEREMGMLLGSDPGFIGYLDEARVPSGLKVVYRP